MCIILISSSSSSSIITIITIITIIIIIIDLYANWVLGPAWVLGRAGKIWVAAVSGSLLKSEIRL